MVWITTPRLKPILNILFFTLLSPSTLPPHSLSYSCSLWYNFVSNYKQKNKQFVGVKLYTNNKHETWISKQAFKHIFIGSGKWKRNIGRLLCFLLTIMSEFMPHCMSQVLNVWREPDLFGSIIRFISWLHFNLDRMCVCLAAAVIAVQHNNLSMRARILFYDFS